MLCLPVPPHLHALLSGAEPGRCWEASPVALRKGLNLVHTQSGLSIQENSHPKTKFVIP